MTRKQILEGMLARNKGHSKKAHGEKTFEQTGFLDGCYRCVLMQKIMKTPETFIKRNPEYL